MTFSPDINVSFNANVPSEIAGDEPEIKVLALITPPEPPSRDDPGSAVGVEVYEITSISRELTHEEHAAIEKDKGLQKYLRERALDVAEEYGNGEPEDTTDHYEERLIEGATREWETVCG